MRVQIRAYLDANTFGDTETIAEEMGWVEFIDTCNEALDQVNAWDGRSALEKSFQSARHCL